MSVATADTHLSPASIENRIVRYRDLRPCLNAFIDTRTPGSDKKENFTIIGPGVSENPSQYVHIAEPHGFNIGGARQPAGCTNSQHSHDTAETFYVHSGTWRFMTGEHADDGEIVLQPGDFLSVPTKIFRGFENVGDGPGFLWVILGGDDPGRVMWAPKVFEMAKDYGLVLMEDGSLIDTGAGEKIPSGKNPMPVTSQAQVDALTRVDSEALAGCAIRGDVERPPGIFDGVAGVTERQLSGPAPIDWPHGFSVAELSLAPDAAIPTHRLFVPDVWFVQSGLVEVTVNGETADCAPGDTITVPNGADRGLRATDGPATLVAVRGGDTLPAVDWAS